MSKLPKCWHESTLGEVCEKPQYGWTTKAVHEGSVKLLRTTDITKGNINWDTVPFCRDEPENIEKYLLRDGDIVVSRAGSVGVSHLVRNPKFSVFASYLIRFKPLIEPEYVAYFLQSPRYWASITQKSAGIALQNVNATKLREIEIPIAPLPEQRRIVARIEELFSRLDAGAAALRHAKAQLQRYRQSVLAAAVTGQLTQAWREQHPNTEPAEELLGKILTERRVQWNGRYKEPIALENGLAPELPYTWTATNIDHLCQVVRGASPRPAGSPEYFGGDIPWITVGSLTADNRKELFAVTDFVTPAGKERSRYVEADTLLLTNSGATLGVPKITRISGCINDGSVALLGVQEPLKSYLYYVLSSMTKRLRKINQGAAQPNLNTTIVKEIAICMPPEFEQIEIVAQVEVRTTAIDHLEAGLDRQLTRSNRLRQSILAAAFSGSLLNS